MYLEGNGSYEKEKEIGNERPTKTNKNLGGKKHKQRKNGWKRYKQHVVRKRDRWKEILKEK